MDLGTTIIGIICIAVCALPFVLMSRNKKKKEKELLTSLKDFAKQHGSEITQHEIAENFAIGLDNSKNTISFLQKTKQEVNLQFVDLNTIKNCEISTINRTLTKNEIEVDKLNLKLNTIDKNKPSIMLAFYNADVNFQLSNEYDSIENWNKVINNLLNNTAKSKAA